MSFCISPDPEMQSWSFIQVCRWKLWSFFDSSSKGDWGNIAQAKQQQTINTFKTGVWGYGQRFTSHVSCLPVTISSFLSVCQITWEKCYLLIHKIFCNHFRSLDEIHPTRRSRSPTRHRDASRSPIDQRIREVDSQCLSEQDRYFSHYDLNMTHFLCHVFIYDRYPSRAQKTVKEFHLSKLNFSQGMTFEIF